MVAILIVDLDRFKQLNESLGYAAGDQILKIAAQRLRFILDSAEMIGRLESDKFVIIYSKMIHTVEAGKEAQRILDQFRSPFDVEGRNLHQFREAARPGAQSLPAMARPDQGALVQRRKQTHQLKPGRSGTKVTPPRSLVACSQPRRT